MPKSPRSNNCGLCGRQEILIESDNAGSWSVCPKCELDYTIRVTNALIVDALKRDEAFIKSRYQAIVNSLRQ